MTPETEKLQWQICVFCGSTCAPDPKVIDNLILRGMTPEKAKEYAEAHVYLVCPRREEHHKTHIKLYPMVSSDQLEHGAYYHVRRRNRILD